MDDVRGDEHACERLKLLRLEMRSSQREFGEPLGFNQAAVSAFEQGKVAFKKPDALAVEYVYGICHEWLLFGRGPKIRDSEELAEDEREVLSIHRQMNRQERPTWTKLGRLLAQQVWNGRSDRRAGDRRHADRRAAHLAESERRIDSPVAEGLRGAEPEPGPPAAEQGDRRR